jgi:hypothetical protein
MSSDAVNSLIEEYGFDSGSCLDDLAMTLKEKYSVVTNGFLSEVFELLYGEVCEFEGELADSYKCPLFKRDRHFKRKAEAQIVEV